MRETTIAALDLDCVLRGFNRGYEGYFMPVHFTREGLERAVLPLDARFNFSPALVDADGEIAGFAFVALRAERAWLWSLGIAPAHRRRGLGLRLLETAAANVREHGAQRMELEVLTQNTAAQALYTCGGFAIQEELIGFTRDPDPRVEAPLKLRWSPAAEILAAVPERPPQDRCWQRQRPSLARLAELWAASRPIAPDIHALYTYNATDLRIADLAIDDAHDARVLTLGLAAAFPAQRLALGNERAGPVAARLPEFGWREIWRQYRMVREFA